MRIINPIEHIRANRDMYLPSLGDMPLSLYLANRLSSDAMMLGATEVDVVFKGIGGACRLMSIGWMNHRATQSSACSSKSFPFRRLAQTRCEARSC